MSPSLKVQTPEQLKVSDLKYYIDARGIQWIKLNRNLTNHFIIKDLIDLSKRMEIEYKNAYSPKFSYILIDPLVYDEYMSDVPEGE
jgi:hypothetical protein